MSGERIELAWRGPLRHEPRTDGSGGFDLTFALVKPTVVAMYDSADEDERLPSGWLEEFHERGDLERAFYLLRRSRGFYANGLRGWIRSLQLRTDAAWVYFYRAYQRFTEDSESILGAARRFGVILFSVETARLDGKVDLRDAPEETTLPEPFNQVIAAYSEAQDLLRTRKVLEGIRHLSIGEPKEASQVFEKLVEEDASVRPEELPQDQLLLAASRMQDGEDVTRDLEIAGQATEECPCMIARARAAANLSGILRHLGDNTKARRWREFLKNQRCPVTTREVFERRAEIIWARCRAEGKIVVL